MTGGVGQQGDGVGGDREAHAARLLAGPLEPEVAVRLADQRPGGDGLRVGEPEPGQGELVRLLVARQSGEDGVQRAAQPARELELVGPPGRPAMPIRSPQRSRESGSSSTSWSSTIASSSVQSVELAKSSDSEPPCSLIVSGVGVTTVRPVYGKVPGNAPVPRNPSRPQGRIPAGAGHAARGDLLRCSCPAGDGFDRAGRDVLVRLLGRGAVRGAHGAGHGRRSTGRDSRGDAAQRALAADGARDRAVPQRRARCSARSSRSRSSTPRSRSPAAAMARTTASGSSVRPRPSSWRGRPAR